MLMEWRYEATDAKIKCGKQRLGLSCREALPYSVTKNQEEMAKTCTNKVFLEKARNSREFQPFSELTFKFRVVTIKFPTGIFFSDRIIPHSLEKCQHLWKKSRNDGGLSKQKPTHSKNQPLTSSKISR